MRAAVHPVPLHGAGVLALTVTTPDAPALHWAKPFWVIVAMLGSDSDHPGWVIGEGDGGWL